MGNTCCGISGVTTGVVNPNTVAELEKKIDHELVANQQKTIQPPMEKGEIIEKKIITNTPLAGVQEKSESNFKRDTNESVAVNSNSLLNFMNNADKPDNVESKPVLDKNLSKEVVINNLNGATPSPNPPKDATYTNEAAPNFEIKKKEDKEKERQASVQKKRRLSKSRHDPTTIKSKPINLEEIKISDETAKKLKKITDGDNEQKPSVAKTPIKRSKTINTNNNEMSENDFLEPTESKYKRPDEFKKSALEDKKNLEKREVIPVMKMKSLKNGDEDGKGERTEKIEEPTLSPKKGLLKRCKTIGDKKKVKFKDVDLKKKKKGR